MKAPSNTYKLPLNVVHCIGHTGSVPMHWSVRTSNCQSGSVGREHHPQQASALHGSDKLHC